MNAFQLDDYFIRLNREAITCQDPARRAYLVEQITAVAHLLSAFRRQPEPTVSADLRRGPLALAIF